MKQTANYKLHKIQQYITRFHCESKLKIKSIQQTKSRILEMKEASLRFRSVQVFMHKIRGEMFDPNS